MKISVVVPFRRWRMPTLVNALYNLKAAADVCKRKSAEEFQESGNPKVREVEIIVASLNAEWRIPYIMQDTIGGCDTLSYVGVNNGEKDSIFARLDNGAAHATGNFVAFHSGQDAVHEDYFYSIFRSVEPYWPEDIGDALIYRVKAMCQREKYRVVPERHLNHALATNPGEVNYLNLVVRRHIAQQFPWSDHRVANSSDPCYEYVSCLLEANKTVYLKDQNLGWSF